MSNRQQRKKQKLINRTANKLLRLMKDEGVDFSFGPRYMDTLEQIDARTAELAQTNANDMLIPPQKTCAEIVSDMRLAIDSNAFGAQDIKTLMGKP